MYLALVVPPLQWETSIYEKQKISQCGSLASKAIATTAIPALNWAGRSMK